MFIHAGTVRADDVHVTALHPYMLLEQNLNLCATSWIDGVHVEIRDRCRGASGWTKRLDFSLADLLESSSHVKGKRGRPEKRQENPSSDEFNLGSNFAALADRS